VDKKAREADPALLAQKARASSLVVIAKRRFLSCLFSSPARLKTRPCTSASEARTKTRRVRSSVADTLPRSGLGPCEIGIVKGICASRMYAERRRCCRSVIATREASTLHTKLFCHGLRRTIKLGTSSGWLPRTDLDFLWSRRFHNLRRVEPPPSATVMANGNAVTLSSRRRIELKSFERVLGDVADDNRVGPRDKARARG
jgi:hypothetical protein